MIKGFYLLHCDVASLYQNHFVIEKLAMIMSFVIVDYLMIHDH